MHQSLLKEVRKFISKGDLDKALEKLSQHYQGTIYEHRIDIIAGRYSKLKSDERLGMVENFDQKINKIAYSLLNEIQQLEIENSPFLAPPDLPYFIGRVEEIQKLENFFFHHSNPAPIICSISGLGGVGKSALAAHFARKHRDNFPDGVFWIRLDHNTVIDVARKIARTLRKEFKKNYTVKEACEYISQWLNGKKALLIFDNVDNVAGISDYNNKTSKQGLIEQIQNIRPDGNSVSILITTRHQELSDKLKAVHMELRSFDVEQGVSLFEKIIQNKYLLRKEAESIKRVIEVFGGLPLAIDLAARAINRYNLTVKAYLDDLGQHGNIFKLLLAGEAIEISLIKSTKLLTPKERKRFFCLGACIQSGFSIETASIAIDEKDIEKTRNFLYALYDLSLIQRRPNNSFGLHPVILSFVRTQHNLISAELRLARHWCKFVKNYDKDLKDDWDELFLEWDSIKASWDWSLNNKEKKDIPILATRFAFHLRYFLDGRGYWQELIDRFPDSLLASKALNSNEDNLEMQFRIRRHLSIIKRKSGDYIYAAQLNIENIIFAESQNRNDWVFQEKEQLGRVRLREGKFEEAEKLYLEALENASTERYKGQANNSLGELYRRKGEMSSAIICFKNALNVYRNSSPTDIQGICATLGHLGNTYSDLEEYNLAKLYYAKALFDFEKAGKIEVKGSLLQNLGYIFQEIDHLKESLLCFIIAANICEQLGINGWRGRNAIESRNQLLLLLHEEEKQKQLNDPNKKDYLIDMIEDELHKIINKIINSELIN